MRDMKRWPVGHLFVCRRTIGGRIWYDTDDGNNLREEVMELLGLSILSKLRFVVKALKGEIMVLYFVMRHRQTPLGVKALTAVVVGYALSPIDLIPDFVPLLGYLDELILLPLAISLVLKLTPGPVLSACREQARHYKRKVKPRLWGCAVVIVLVWLVVLYKVWTWLQ